MVFIFQMEAIIGQEGLTEEFETKDHLPVGKKGVNIADIKGLYGEERIIRVFRVWNLLLQQITHMPTVTQTVENGSPSGAWRLFKNYFEPQQEADKARWTQEYFRLDMGATEPLQDYLGRSHILRSKLGSHGFLPSEKEFCQHVARNLTDYISTETSSLLNNPGLTADVLDNTVRAKYDAKGEGVEQRGRTRPCCCRCRPDRQARHICFYVYSGPKSCGTAAGHPLQPLQSIAAVVTV